MKGSNWFEEHFAHLGDDRAAQMRAVRYAVEQGWDVAWPMQPVDSNGVTFFAAADYFAIGEPTDFVYVPLDAPTAQWLADLKGCVLPTRKMVKAIWYAADARVNGAAMPMTPGQGYPYTSDMFNVRRYPVHTERVLAALAKVEEGRPLVAALIAGHKKDVVLTNRLLEKRGQRVAIYGWQRTDGTPIQGPGVSIKHVASYFDYSHGIRLVASVCQVGPVETPVVEVLQDENNWTSLSDEGPLRVLGYRYTGDDEPQPDTDRAPPAGGAEDVLPGIKRGSRGSDVAKWQRYLIWREHDLAPWGADGDFGRVTHAATVLEQQKHLAGVQYTPGVVGDETWGLYRTPPEVVLPKIELSDAGLPDIPFVQAAHYTAARRTDVRTVVIHTMEAGEHPGTAENVAAWFAGQSAPQASCHYNVDGDSIVQSVREEHVAWHAKGGNRYSIGIEHAGYARQTDEQWRDPYSVAMLVLSAKLVAGICTRWRIPFEFVDVAGLRAGRRGITYHRTVSKAFKIKGGHTDPGENFPLDTYLSMVRAATAKFGITD